MAALPMLKMNSNRKGLFFAGLLVAVVFLTYPLFLRTPLASPSVPSVVKPAGVSDKRAVMPAGFQQQASVRDPFQMPMEQLSTASAVAASGYNLPAMLQPLARPQFQLMGVAMGNGTSVAILESSAGSRTYRVGETADSYLVHTISLDSVTLVGPGGTYVLPLRR